MDRATYLLKQSQKDCEFYRSIALTHLEAIRRHIEMLIDYIEGRDDARGNGPGKGSGDREACFPP